MVRLDEVTWPQPLAGLLEAAYEPYRETHPWLHPDLLDPKWVVREIVEQGMAFTDFVGRYGWPGPRGWCCATSPTPTGRCADGARLAPDP